MDLSQSFPNTRMRRIRSHGFARDLFRETTVHVKNLIFPMFVQEGTKKKDPIPSMPGIYRFSLDVMLKELDTVAKLGIPAIALFPVIEDGKKDLKAKESFNDKGLVPKVIGAIKKNFPELGVITDIALDPYTSHGQDGIIDDKGSVLNDVTIEVLVKQALCHANAGADIVAPSDMMDGRIGAIREALERDKFENTLILAYAAKYASAFYGPFRDAVGSKSALGKADKNTYQMDIGNSDEALREVALDLQEGADMVMVKPGLPYLDIIRRVHDQFGVPTLAYNVSGEYAMVKAASAQEWIDEKKCVLEMMTSFCRAGAGAVLTYHALDVAKWLTEP